MSILIKFWTPNGYYGFLSNFYAAETVVDSCVYPTNEHFFQSQKFIGTQHEIDIINSASPAESAKMGKSREYPLRKDWEQVKEEIMRIGLRAKFRQHPELREKLLATGAEALIENSPYDYYWGIGKDGTGQNRLGVLLMQVRSELQ